MKRIVLMGAMDMEVAPFLEEIEEIRTVRVGPFAVYEGKLGGAAVAAVRCGVGKVNAAMTAQVMLQHYSAGLVVHTGVGGSLTDRLTVGDVLIADHCVQYDVDTSALGDPVGFVSTVNRVEFPCDEQAVRQIDEEAEGLRGRGKSVCVGCAATGDRFLIRGEEKREIAEAFGALVCDQESCAIAQVCGVNGVPCAVIRAVSDASDDHHGEEYENYAPDAAKTAAELAIRFVRSHGRDYV